MVDVPMRSEAPFTSRTVLTINRRKVQGPRSSRDLTSINHGTSVNSVHAAGTSGQRPSFAGQASAAPPGAARVQAGPVRNMAPPADKPVPGLLHTIQKGQKVSLETSGKPTKIRACFGWNMINPACDVDVSAFLLNEAGRVIGDNWFVFYGQTQSPDNSTVFHMGTGMDREIISVDFTCLNPAVVKIVFVLTINEAFEKKLNFSMLKDAYVRILDGQTESELVSFRMEEYYANVTSMMIGEIYQHKGVWKFNAIGNGVARDLAGLCELYGVQVI